MNRTIPQANRARTSGALLGATALLGALTIPMAPGAAAAATTCKASMPSITLDPGLALTKKTAGKFRNKGKGTVTCDGPVLGKKPTGTGVFTRVFGTFEGSCAAGGTGTNTYVFEFPTKDGTVKLVTKGPFTFGALKGGAVGGEYDNPKAKGSFSTLPKKGNCVSEPVTELSAEITFTLKG